MKKFLSLLLVLSLAAAFSACGNQEAPSTEIADENTTTALTQEKTEATEEKAESPKETQTEVPATSTEGADEIGIKRLKRNSYFKSHHFPMTCHSIFRRTLFI